MDRIKNFRTLKDENIDKERAFNEILNSPVFKNLVISDDASTTGIIVNIKEEKPKREDLLKMKKTMRIIEINLRLKIIIISKKFEK